MTKTRLLGLDIDGCLPGYAMGWGPITWLLMSEVLPLVARGVASGLCIVVSWLTAFLLTYVFTLLVDGYGLYVPYLWFMIVCVLCLLFNALCIPETRGRSLEEIENYFRTGITFDQLDSQVEAHNKKLFQQ